VWEDDDYIISRLKNQYSLTLSPHQLKTIKEIGGGHPYLLKEACQILADRFSKKLATDQIRDIFYDNYELRWVIGKVFEIRSSEEKNILSKIALRQDFSKDKNKEAFDFLLKMGLVKKIGGELRPFNKLFSRTIQGFEKNEIASVNARQEDLNLDKETSAIIYKGRTIGKISREYSVLTELLRTPDSLITRDDIGKILWGKEMYEKYSDWALDQLISKLRKKLSGLDIRGRLITIRGKGYKFLRNA
jgi:DNA-binding response OmpR family regulator